MNKDYCQRTVVEALGGGKTQIALLIFKYAVLFLPRELKPNHAEIEIGGLRQPPVLRTRF